MSMSKKKHNAEETTEETSEEEEVVPGSEETPTETPTTPEAGSEVELDGMFEDYQGRSGGKKATIKQELFEKLVSRAKVILDERQREQTMSLETVNKVLGTTIKNSNGFAYALKEGIDVVDEKGEIVKDGTSIITTEDILLKHNVYIGTYGGKLDKKTRERAPQGLTFKRGFTGAPSKQATASE